MIWLFKKIQDHDLISKYFICLKKWVEQRLILHFLAWTPTYMKERNECFIYFIWRFWCYWILKVVISSYKAPVNIFVVLGKSFCKPNGIEAMNFYNFFIIFGWSTSSFHREQFHHWFVFFCCDVHIENLKFQEWIQWIVCLSQHVHVMKK